MAYSCRVGVYEGTFFPFLFFSFLKLRVQNTLSLNSEVFLLIHGRAVVGTGAKQLSDPRYGIIYRDITDLFRLIPGSQD